LLDVLARRDHRGGAVVEADRRRAGWTRQAFLQAGRREVDLPAVHLERVAAERGRGIDVEQHVVPAAERADRGERLQHGGGRIAVTDRDQFGPMLPDRGLDRVGLEHFAPFGVDPDDLAPRRRPISILRWPKRPNTGTSILSPGASTEARHASMPARAVPSTSRVQWFSVRNTRRYSAMT
jgi:hypothetical protein